MKKILVLAILMLSSVFVFATAPTDEIADAVYWWDLDTALSSADNFDSLKLITDSSTILTKFSPKKLYQYMLGVGRITGTSIDTMKIRVVGDAYGTGAGGVGDSFIYRLEIDSITSGSGEMILIPFGETFIGSKFDIKFIDYNTVGTTINYQINELYLYKRRAVTLRKLHE